MVKNNKIKDKNWKIKALSEMKPPMQDRVIPHFLDTLIKQYSQKDREQSHQLQCLKKRHH